MELTVEQLEMHTRYVEILPELKAATAYGAATKLIRAKLDKNFGKETEGEKQTWIIKLECERTERENFTFKVEAWSKEEAEDEACELASEEGSWDDIMVTSAKTEGTQNAN